MPNIIFHKQFNKKNCEKNTNKRKKKIEVINFINSFVVQQGMMYEMNRIFQQDSSQTTNNTNNKTEDIDKLPVF